MKDISRTRGFIPRSRKRNVVSVKKMYEIQETDTREFSQLSEIEKDIYCWLTDDVFNTERVSKIQKKMYEKTI